MESYTVFARRYRPRFFDDVVGQEHVATTLKNAILESRVGHAYLFCGPRGVGKTSMARIFAKALNCEKGATERFCDACDSCRRVQDGNDQDVIEIDAASNRMVEDARALRESVRYAPLRSRFKVYIVDEAHMLTKDAFNTLLKTLEEPPRHVKFVFATTEIHKMPDTIVSRCQRFDFARLTTQPIARRLKQVCDGEKLSVPEDVLLKIAQVSRGAMRDAESLLDQLIAFKETPTVTDVNMMVGAASDELVWKLLEAVRAQANAEVLRTLNQIFAAGVDATAFADQVIELLRLMMIVKACGKDQKIVDAADSTLQAASKIQETFSLEALLYAMQLLLEARRRLRDGLNPQIVLELTFVKMASIADLMTLGDALKAMDRSAPQKPAPVPEVKAQVRTPALVQAPAADVAGWPRFVELVKERTNPLYEAILRECKPSAVEGDRLAVHVPALFNNAFHGDKIKRLTGELASVVSRCVEEAFGRKLTLTFSVETGAPALRSKEPEADPSVKKILDKFQGSKVIDVQ